MNVIAPRAGPKPEPVSPRLTKRLAHPDREARVVRILFTPDGGRIIGSSYPDGGVQIWDARTGEQLRTLRLPKGRSPGSTYLLTLAPDGRTLFVPLDRSKAIPTRKDGKPGYRYEADGEILVWDLADGRPLPSLKHTPPRGIVWVQLAPDGHRLFALEQMAAEDGKGSRYVLTLWDTRSRSHRHLLDGRWFAAFAPDGKTFAADFNDYQAGRGKLALWDTSSGRERLVFGEGRKVYFGGQAFSPDGRYLAASRDTLMTDQPAEMKLWDTATGKEVGSIAGPAPTSSFNRPGHITGTFTQAAFSPDGRWLATTARDDWVFLYDVAGRKLAWSRNLRITGLSSPLFSPDGRWLAVTAQELPKDRKPREELSPFDLPQPRIFLFDLKAGGEPEVVVAPHGHPGQPVFSPDGKTLALGGPGCVWLFDVRPRGR